MLLHDKKTDRKYRFVDEFEEEDPKVYLEKDEEEEPKKIKTKFFGERALRQIARVEWKEFVVVQEKERVLSDGSTETVEENVVFYQEIMGELGGWLESEVNLSQNGDCWVGPGSYVMDGAYVCDDAVVSNGAEIGDDAKITGNVEINGPIGIGGSARILDKARIVGDQRLAVFGSAVVQGISVVADKAKVYGHATVGWNPRTNEGYGKAYRLNLQTQEYEGLTSYVTGNARVYGNSTVYGTVSEDAEIYGRSVVEGFAYGKAHVGGTAFVGQSGQVSGEVRLLRGEVYGRLGGKKVEILYPRFHLSASSSLDVIVFEDGQEEDEADKLSDEEKDELEDRPPRKYNGKVKSLLVYRGCLISGCGFEGDVEMIGCVVRDCRIADSVLGPMADLEKEGNSSYSFGRLDNSSIDTGSFKLIADDCYFEKCLLPYGRYVGSEMVGCSACQKKTDYSRFYANVLTVSDSEMEDCVILKYCQYVMGCGLKGVTADSVSLVKKEIEDCAVIQSTGSTHYGIYPIRYQTNSDSDNVVLIGPNDYGKYLGSAWWGDYSGVGEMPGIASFVMAFDGVPDKLYWESDMSVMYEMTERQKELNEELSKIAKERDDWFNGVLDGLSEEMEGLRKDGNVEGALAISRLISYLARQESFAWQALSEASFGKIKAAVENTVDSFDGKNFAPLGDVGEMELLPEIAEFEDKYWISFVWPSIRLS